MSEVHVPALAKVPEEPEFFSHFALRTQNDPKKPLPYRIFVPEGHKGPLPVVLHLHGVRGRGSDNETQLAGGNRFGPAYFASEAVQSKFPCIVVVPQCPAGRYWVNFTMVSSTKYLRKTVALIQEIKETYAVDPSRIYISGQSMGGFATWAAMTEFADVFAAGIAVSGGGNPRKAKRSLKSPIWVFHGAKDPLVGVWRSRIMADTMEKAGRPIRFTEYADGRHDIWPFVYSEVSVAEWLFGHSLVPSVKR